MDNAVVALVHRLVPGITVWLSEDGSLYKTGPGGEPEVSRLRAGVPVQASAIVSVLLAQGWMSV